MLSGEKEKYRQSRQVLNRAPSELGGVGGVARNHCIVGGNGEEVGQLLAGGELVEEADGLREVPAVPARLSQLPAQGTSDASVTVSSIIGGPDSAGDIEQIWFCHVLRQTKMVQTDIAGSQATDDATPKRRLVDGPFATPDDLDTSRAAIQSS